jgi:hypothetical protein
MPSEFVARVRATVLLPITADVPDLQFEPVRVDPNDDVADPGTKKRPGEQATNEQAVLDARAQVGISAEQAARDAFAKFTVIDVVVEEVTEA